MRKENNRRGGSDGSIPCMVDNSPWWIGQYNRMITTFSVWEFLLDRVTLNLIGWFNYLDNVEWRITIHRIRCCAFEDDNSPGM